MIPKPAGPSAFELFQAHFHQILNLDHPLCQLADRIDWPRFEAVLADCYSEDMGRPGLATRLMAGLHYLKHAFNESDESLVERWVENPYWQYFCGFDYLQHECPLHPTSLVKWRQRVGAERFEMLLAETIRLAQNTGQVKPQELRRVNVDTCPPEKPRLTATFSLRLPRIKKKEDPNQRQVQRCVTSFASLGWNGRSLTPSLD